MDTSETYYNMCKKAFPKDAAVGNCFKTQDQLQEMLIGCKISDQYGSSFIAENWHELISPFYDSFLLNSCDDDGLCIFTSMEQLWLAFVMKEKYNKTWGGENWAN